MQDVEPGVMVGPTVSFIVPTKDSAETIGACLSSIRAQRHARIEIVVVDNHSLDATAEIARTYADVVAVGGPERSAQRNLGARLSSGSILVFLDSDMMLEDGVAQAAASCCGEDGPFDLAVIPERSIGEGFWARCRVLEKQLYLGDHNVEAARVFRRPVFEALGGYEPTLTGGEDWDLPDRAKKAGYLLGRLDRSVIHDEGRPTLKWIFAKKRYYGRSVHRYLNRQGATGARRLLRTGLFRRPGVLVSRPVDAVGLLLLKTVDSLALGLGMVEGIRTSRHTGSSLIEHNAPEPAPASPSHGTGGLERPATTTAPKAKGLLRRYGESMFSKATDDNINQIAKYCGSVPLSDAARVLDLGCWDGTAFLRYAPQAHLYGVEAHLGAARAAASLSIATVSADLNQCLPYRDGSFDLVVSNQVIEHLADTDTFVAECLRLLRPGGHVAISTENLASWHNVFSLLLGWQAFSLANVSSLRSGLGNPLANLRTNEGGLEDTGWQHRRIFSHRGLIELLEAHGFEDVGIRAAGYYPLPSRTARLDPRHAAFLTVVGRRP